MYLAMRYLGFLMQMRFRVPSLIAIGFWSGEAIRIKDKLKTKLPMIYSGLILEIEIDHFEER